MNGCLHNKIVKKLNNKNVDDIKFIKKEKYNLYFFGRKDNHNIIIEVNVLLDNFSYHYLELEGQFWNSL